MEASIKTGSVHHVALTVNDLPRSVEFYSGLFGFKPIIDLGTRVLMHNGSMVLAVTLPPDPSQAIAHDRFNENRVGMDHLSLLVDSRQDLVDAAQLLDGRGVSHGEIKDMGEGMKLYVMAIRDPDNIQIELTAPYG